LKISRYLANLRGKNVVAPFSGHGVFWLVYAVQNWFICRYATVAFFSLVTHHALAQFSVG